ncbi:hypothetical protein [Legionella saoudiensis]|uniref:hypothetical protein n=1 Tax=Legionella saoudiensis TaxID=1750561 RepID=UPI00072FF732|nr:hypothetical protein [Legionella saoudiensis]
MTQLNTPLSGNPNTQQLLLLLDALRPLLNDLRGVLADAKKFHSKYQHHLNHLNLYLKMSNAKEPEMGDVELEEWVNHIGSILEGLGNLMIEISHDKEESKFYIENGVMVRLQEIAQKFVLLISE